ncbi:MAG: hypothetical protein DRO13_05015 [Thermoprotei archaeon]|nr:MAG: hypothetical protein DRO13_05015 [Thermoprotei archaeon]
MILVLVAGGILGYGVHELLKYAEKRGLETGIWGHPIYSLGIDEKSVFHEENIVGSVLAVLIGFP